MKLSNMPALLKREFIEDRNMMLYVPLVIAVLLVLLQVTMLVAIEGGWFDVNVQYQDDVDGPREFRGSDYHRMLETLPLMDPREREQMLDRAYFVFSMPLLAVVWFYVFFYLLACLYDDRRDRSILFWKSMPVSDAATVVSKLVTALILIPASYFAFAFLVQAGLLVTTSLSAADLAPEVSSIVWRPLDMFGIWLQVVVFHLLTIAWCLPFYGWIVLVSSAARSVPFVWALLVPFILVTIDRLFLTGQLGEVIARHVIPVGYDDEDPRTFAQIVTGTLTDWELPLAVAIGCGFIYLAIVMRGKADEL